MPSLVRCLWGGVLAVLLAGVAGAKGPELVRAEIGFANHYRVGCWVPLRATFQGGDQPGVVGLSAVAPDSDALAVLYTPPPAPPTAVLPGEEKAVELLIRVGQREAPVTLNVVSSVNGKNSRSTVKLSPYKNLDDGGINGAWPATIRHILEVGETGIGLAEAFGRSSNNADTMIQSTQVTDLTKLPRSGLGYESIDTVVLSTSGNTPLRNLRASDVRIEALREWVASGGKLVICCAQNADVLLAPDGPLAGFIGGRFVANATIDQPSPLERFADSREPIGPRGQTQITVARLTDVTGQIEAFTGEQPTDLPLVVRHRLGFGRVTLIVCDLDRQPLRGWKGLPQLVQRLVDENFEPDRNSDEPIVNYGGVYDFADQVRATLDSQLEVAGVRTPPFLAIAGLVLLYILLIGPFDYWLVRRVLKRMEATWITFPTIVVATCVGAYWLAYLLKGDQQIVNQVEVVDVDVTTGDQRGTLWNHVFSPQPKRLSLAAAPLDERAKPLDAETATVAWLGQTGMGLGHMGQTASSNRFSGPSYAIGPGQSKMQGRPIQVWSTRTTTARWQASSPALLTGELSLDVRESLQGTVSNASESKLLDCHLFHGDWVWRLGTIRPGSSVTIDDSQSIKTASYVRLVAGDRDPNINIYQRWRLNSDLSMNATVQLMMLADHFDAEQITGLMNRYQHFVDLSHCLNDETAILVGRIDERRCNLVDEDGPLDSSGGKGASVTFYRYLLPVASEAP